MSRREDEPRLKRLIVEIRRRPLPRHGTDHDSKPLPPAQSDPAEQRNTTAGDADPQDMTLAAIPPRAGQNCMTALGLARELLELRRATKGAFTACSSSVWIMEKSIEGALADERSP